MESLARQSAPSRAPSATPRPGISPKPGAGASPAPVAAAATDTGLRSREDAALDAMLDGLACTAAALEVSMRTWRKHPENVVYRASVEQQYHAALGQLAPLLRTPLVLHADEPARMTAARVAHLEKLAAELQFLGGSRELREALEAAAAEAWSPEATARDGRPCGAYESLLEAHGVRRPDLPPAPPPPQREILFEKLFDHADGNEAACVGELYLGLMIHGRGMSPEQAKAAATPAALVGFAQSIEKALADHRGVAAFRVVRENGQVSVQLSRLATRR